MLEKLQEAETLMKVYYTRINAENLASGLMMGERNNYRFTQNAHNQVRFTLIVNGMYLMLQANDIKDAFGRKAKNPKYKSIFDELNNIYAERAEKAR